LTAPEGSRDIGAVRTVGGACFCVLTRFLRKRYGFRAGWDFDRPSLRSIAGGCRAHQTCGLRGVRALVSGALAAIAASVISAPAKADFRLCNNTGNRVGIAIGYKENESWTTEGWWNISARSCETVLRGTLVARFYYIYAVDYDRGGEWSGQAFMCSREKRVHHSRHRGLLGARLRPHGLLRGRHRRSAVMDRSAHRIGRPDPDAAPCSRRFRCCRRRRPPAGRVSRRPRPEAEINATSASDQDRRHPRPCILRPERDRQAVRGRRRRVPHQHEPHLA